MDSEERAHFLFLGYVFVWLVIKIEKVLSENKLNIYKKYKESYLSLSLVWNIIAAGFTITNRRFRYLLTFFVSLIVLH